MLSGICVRTGNISCLLMLLFIPSWSQQFPADKLISEGHYGRARHIVQAALEKNPQDVNALVQLSTIQWAFGQLDASTTTAERAVAAADGSAKAHAQLLNTLGAKLASSKTSTLDKMILTRRFHKEADRTLQLDPINLYAHEALTRFYWYAPGMAGGSKAKARQWLNKLLQLDAVRGYGLKAELDATESDKTRSLSAVQADWKQAVAADSASYAAHVGFARSLLASGSDKLNKAEDEAKIALALDPSRVESYRLLAAMYVTTARWDYLDATLRRARAAVPDDLAAEFIAAQLILDRNIASQWSRAEQHLRNYMKQPCEGLEPTMAIAHWKLGIVLEKEGLRSAALKELEIAVELDPTLDEARKDLNTIR